MWELTKGGIQQFPREDTSQLHVMPSGRDLYERMIVQICALASGEVKLGFSNTIVITRLLIIVNVAFLFNLRYLRFVFSFMKKSQVVDL